MLHFATYRIFIVILRKNYRFSGHIYITPCNIIVIYSLQYENIEVLLFP